MDARLKGAAEVPKGEEMNACGGLPLKQLMGKAGTPTPGKARAKTGTSLTLPQGVLWTECVPPKFRGRNSNLQCDGTRRWGL